MRYWLKSINELLGNVTKSVINLGFNVRCNRRRKASFSYELQFESLESRQLMATLYPGDVTQGLIGSTGEVDKFQFAVGTNDVVDLRIANESAATPGFVPRGRLFSPSGTLIRDFDSNSGNQRLTLPAGIYDLRVRDNDQNQTGYYSIGYEKLKPASPDAVTIVRGEVRQGLIGHRIEKDQFVFHANLNDVFDLVIRNSGNQQAGFVATAEVISPLGQSLHSFNSGSGVLRVTAPVSGTYIVQVSDNDGGQTGYYDLALEGIKVRSSDIGAVSIGQTVSGLIGHMLERDQFSFYARAGEKFELAIRNSGGVAGFNIRANLYAPNGVSSAGSFNTHTGSFRFTATVTGNYMVMVEDDYMNQTGYYVLGVERVLAASPDATTLNVGEVSQGLIGGLAEKDQWAFNGSAGQVVDLVLKQTSNNYGYSPVAELYSPAGNIIRTFTGNAVNQRITLPAAGKYIVQIRDDNLVDTGYYSLGFYSISPVSSNAVGLARNVWHNGLIGNQIEKDQFVMNATAGQTVTVQASHSPSSSPFFDPLIEVFSANGTLLTTFRSSQGSRTLTLNYSGPFLIMVSDFGFDATGYYSLRWY